MKIRYVGNLDWEDISTDEVLKKMSDYASKGCEVIHIGNIIHIADKNGEVIAVIMN